MREIGQCHPELVEGQPLLPRQRRWFDKLTMTDEKARVV
jgi:hypothetical protein